MRSILSFCFICLPVWVFSQTDTIVWHQGSKLPESLSSCQMGYFLIDSDLYIAGGWIGGTILSDQVWRYHIPSDTWYQMQNMPFGAAATSCPFVLNGKGYFLTARDSVLNQECDRMFWEYNPVIDSWARMADFPDSPRQQSSNFVYNGKGYVGQTYGCQETDTHFWEYNPYINQWSQVATLSADVAAGSTAIATLPAMAYLFGGYDHNGNLLNDVWCYNIIANQWDSIGQIPGDSGRFFPVFWGLDSVIIGGAGLNGFDILSDYYIYSIYQNLWAPIVFQNFSDSAYYGATFIWNKTAYYFGGPTDPVQYTSNIGIWSADVSKYMTDTSTGIKAIKPDAIFKVYPNPLPSGQEIIISTSLSGDISFSDDLGRVIDERRIERGINRFTLNISQGVLFYKATLQDGSIMTGKVVVY